MNEFMQTLDASLINVAHIRRIENIDGAWVAFMKAAKDMDDVGYVLKSLRVWPASKLVQPTGFDVAGWFAPAEDEAPPKKSVFD